MPAHKREIIRTCMACGRTAEYEVYNTRNAPVGYFCRKHADDKVTELNRRDGRKS